VIAIGAGLILRRTRAGLPGGLLAAALPGLVFGGMIVAVPDMPDLADWTAHCGDAPAAEAVTERQGTLGETASVDLSLACGRLAVSTGPGAGWAFDASGRGDGAVITESADRLSIRSSDRVRPFASNGWGDGHGEWGHDWRLRLPAGTLLDVDATVSAGEARFDLAGARMGTLRLGLNAGEARLDATGATLSRLEVEVNAGAATVLLPDAGDFGGTMTVNAGSLEICAPAGLGLRVRGETALGATTFNGLVRVGDAWESPGYTNATSRADLAVSASVGSVVVNPEGGCS
jgi:hypothetical protein